MKGKRKDTSVIVSKYCMVSAKLTARETPNTMWRQQHEASANILTFMKCFSRERKKRHRNPNMHLTSEMCLQLSTELLCNIGPSI